VARPSNAERRDNLQTAEARRVRLMRCYPVSTRITRVVNDDEECCRRVEITRIRDKQSDLSNRGYQVNGQDRTPRGSDRLKGVTGVPANIVGDKSPFHSEPPQ
jgi:hypothetical protein